MRVEEFSVCILKRRLRETNCEIYALKKNFKNYTKEKRKLYLDHYWKIKNEIENELNKTK